MHEFGEFFHFYMYICTKGGTCEDLGALLTRPPPELTAAQPLDTRSAEEYLLDICPP